MSSGHRALTAFLALLYGLLALLVGRATGWPDWLWPALAGALLLGGAALFALTRGLRGRAPQENALEQRVVDVALPSAEPDYPFLFSATVRWLPREVEGMAYFDPGGIAVASILLRARAFTARQDPADAGLAQHRLNAVLGVMEADPSGRVLAMARNVHMALVETDRERLSRLADVRKDEEVWEHERNYERNKRSYLSTDVLSDPGSAVVWWLANHDDEVAGAVERIGLLAQLSAAANNGEVPPPFRPWLPRPEQEPHQEDDGASRGPATPPAERLLDTLCAWLAVDRDDPDLVLVAERLAQVLRASDRPEEADQLADLVAHVGRPPPGGEEHTQPPPEG
ncbi:hypothetical protein [Streptomyces triticirhizae]|uniref:Uncharacterized protein n=1 Tax=Streptomyces triticirhizae TaxID=2483353 RepID=A0A3M2LAD1_9ACTN|nr:hypothetical protein [Streptomyces triticirhizae]RMI34541.1 hypothetical protein EBN88_23645 [Streptomyces triticirhizae]